MDNFVKQCIIFVSGAAIGGVCTWIGVKAYYENKADSEIDECKEMYENKERELRERYSIEISNSIENSDLKPDTELKGIEGTTTSIDMKKGEKEPLIDYTRHFKHHNKEVNKDLDMIKRNINAQIDAETVTADECEHIDPAEEESPDDDELTDEEDDLEQEDYEMYIANEEHKKAIAENRQPYEIDASVYNTIPWYDSMDLYYFVQDGVLCDENHEEVDMPGLFVGDLLETDWVSDERENIYIRADQQMMDVEVHKNFEDKFYSE